MKSIPKPGIGMEKYQILKEDQIKYGQLIKEGDTLRIQVVEGKVEFFINGVSQGVAFTGVVLPEVHE